MRGESDAARRVPVAVEPVSFLKPGRYLVICAVLPHFNDKMYAWVEVRPRGQGQGQGGITTDDLTSPYARAGLQTQAGSS